MHLSHAIRGYALLSLSPEHRYILNARCPRSGNPLPWATIANELQISVSEAQKRCTEAQEELAKAIALIDPPPNLPISRAVLDVFNSHPSRSGVESPTERVSRIYDGHKKE